MTGDDGAVQLLLLSSCATASSGVRIVIAI